MRLIRGGPMRKLAAIIGSSACFAAYTCIASSPHAAAAPDCPGVDVNDGTFALPSDPLTRQYLLATAAYQRHSREGWSVDRLIAFWGQCVQPIQQQQQAQAKAQEDLRQKQLPLLPPAPSFDPSPLAPIPGPPAIGRDIQPSDHSCANLNNAWLSAGALPDVASALLAIRKLPGFGDVKAGELIGCGIGQAIAGNGDDANVGMCNGVASLNPLPFAPDPCKP